MAESGRYIPIHRLDLTQILREAHNRWLRPAEICEILRNYQKFQLAPDPPIQPPAGSLFLFDRKAIRYFRKDGHRWRKKKDGKTVKEAHEKLKAGSVDVLHCYYAHGEDNENFQRRSYWMLDGQLEHIVLVHYREVNEGYKSGISPVFVDPRPQAEDLQGGSTPTFVEANSPVGTVVAPCPLDPGQTIGNESVDSSARHNSGVCSDVHHVFSSSVLPPTSVPADDVSGSSIQYEIPSFRTHGKVFAGQKILTEQSGMTNFITYIPAATTVSQKVVQIGKTSKDHLNHEGLGELKKLDSFSRWMDKEIGGDCDNSLMTLDSGKYWCSLDAGNEDKEVSSFSLHMQLDVDSLGPSLSQEQLFSIHDFSPDWTYSGNVTKVLIVGSFLGSKKLSADTKWGCMFGEVEVSAEVLTSNVLRCQTPSHAPGRIPFYVTCSNRLACSEVREFEYREKPSTGSVPNAIKCAPEDETRFQMRLTRLLALGPEKKWLNCSIQECEKCKIRSATNSSRSNCAKSGGMIEGSHVPLKSHRMNPRDLLIQTLLEDKLCDWLVCNAHEGTRGMLVLDNEGQGVIHLAAALGYEWAIGPMIVYGVSPNYRDLNGRTALHWASYFGREETVITLVKLGAAPGAVDDPAIGFPGGQTAADLASSRGHKGIAGYLAEADLAAHLSTLTDTENLKDNVKASSDLDEAVQTAEELVVDELLSLKSSLAAVRKSVHAAALIHAAFRARSFRHKQLTKGSDAIPEDSDLVALGVLNKTQKIHYEDYLHVAAVRIQQNYRGWKGRKDFLKIRNHIVKIQAHVRGYQVRKQYKKVVWSVSIVEKAILRWRRKRVGLRGFKVEEPIGTVIQEAEKSDEYEFLRIGRKLKYADVEKALSRVQSMARCPEARHQYMRLLAKFENLKMIDEEIKQLESSQETDQEEHLSSFAAYQ